MMLILKEKQKLLANLHMDAVFSFSVNLVLIMYSLLTRNAFSQKQTNIWFIARNVDVQNGTGQH